MKDKKYSPSEIEPKWQKVWESDKTYSPDINNAKNPFYNLMMFPYPSAEGLHVGNMYAFTGADVYGRFKRMQGNDVFEPIGLDGFGIHSENYALKVGRHPKEQAKVSEKNFYRQLESIGNSFDLSKTLETYDPKYYKWTQWLFITLFKSGLAYRKKAEVNWCPSCKTVLSDEQVIDAKCERCGTKVEKKMLEQWFFRITDYAQRLLDNIETLDWTEKVKIAQRNWIGRSEGAQVKFPLGVEGQPEGAHSVEVFTTRPDTLYGATFVVVSPELAQSWIDVGWQANDEVKKYIVRAKAKTDIERTAEDREKTGVDAGITATNPVNNKQIPVWVADYVLSSYGTGAIMAVPAHDQRDFEFAKKYNLEIVPVIQEKGKDIDPMKMEEALTGQGIIIGSENWNGFHVPEDIGKVIDDLEKRNIGTKKVNYHLRDWLISRQRYWGPPIPMIFCSVCAEQGRSWFTSEEGKSSEVESSKYQVESEKKQATNYKLHTSNDMAGWYPVPEEDLPVALPDVEDWKPMGTEKSPLANHPEFYQTKCPGCGSDAQRETDVSDTFLDSAWYFLRYVATDWDDMPFPSVELAKNKKSKAKNQKEIENSAQRATWFPVNMYIGGAEHSVLHLLYSRFVTMALKDMGYLDFEEPFSKFYAHGLIIKDGAKMSKSKGNVVVPDEYIAKYGADALRTYLMFVGPFSDGGDFSDSGLEGIFRFLKRVWKVFEPESSAEMTDQDKQMMHKTIKKVTEDIADLRYNTAIAALMEWYNYLSKGENGLSNKEKEVYLKLLSPFAPHLTEELWQALGNENSIHVSSWPEYDENLIVSDNVTIVIQVNGKRRAEVEVDNEKIEMQKEVENIAKEAVEKYLGGSEIRKVIYVPGKIINFVI